MIITATIGKFSTQTRERTKLPSVTVISAGKQSTGGMKITKPKNARNISGTNIASITAIATSCVE